MSFIYFVSVVYLTTLSVVVNFFSFLWWGETESTWYVGLLYRPQMIDECGAVGGMRIGRGNRGTWRKPAQVPLCPPQIPHDPTWARTRATNRLSCGTALRYQ
jgi:hypothetical protein